MNGKKEDDFFLLFRFARKTYGIGLEVNSQQYDAWLFLFAEE